MVHWRPVEPLTDAASYSYNYTFTSFSRASQIPRPTKSPRPN
jgi:hypothetical protein